MEREVVADVLKTKALITANLMALPNMAKDANKESFELFKKSTELLLPNDEKSANMKEMTKEDKIKIRESLKLANQQLKDKIANKSSKTKRQKLK